jgi:extracellular factor (EF) 3-hydroxypalmitic acid methyl ester biosynthesis protein
LRYGIHIDGGGIVIALSMKQEIRMAGINSRFKKVFSDLEKGHIAIRKRLNSFSERGHDLEERLSQELEKFEPWRFELMDDLGAIVSNFDAEHQEEYQDFIRNTRYHEIVQEAPFYWRIMNKPNGYPGDASMMSFIYRNQFEGKTPFGMFLHKHAVSTKACQSVRNRKLYLTQQIIKANSGKILSLAAGPAQEMTELLDVFTEDNFQFIALDHDMDTLKKFTVSDKDPRFKYALANAFQIISGNYMTARPRKLMEKFCHPRKDFKGLNIIFSSLKYELDYLKKDDFDLVYSSGLFDYIKTFPLDDSRGTVALTKNLFDLVKPGGSLIVGNFSHHNPRDLRFVMEYIFDWKLTYRNKDEMINFARTIPEKEIGNIKVIEESLGINYFLKIDKKSEKSDFSLSNGDRSEYRY